MKDSTIIASHFGTIYERMASKKGSSDSEALMQTVVGGMQDKKAKQISIIDLRKTQGAVADYFVICTGGSDTQLDAISGGVEEAVLKKYKEFPKNVEGKMNKEWVLMDYINVVAHIFKDDRRSFYGLEELWGDAPIIKIEETEGMS